MDEVRFRMLRRKLGAPLTTPSELMRCAQAARELASAGVFSAASPQMVQKVRERLHEILMTAERFGTFESNRASGLASRVLEQLDEDEAARAKPPYDAATWMADDLDERARRAWMALDLLPTMAHALGWTVEWQPHLQTRLDAERIEWLEREAEAILNAEDVLGSATDWLNAHWQPELVSLPRGYRPGSATAAGL